mmetsp:Transcript_3637/g.13876  ORF Transcript_3637/g.13876 Transcript_3637/m.13876 type:complete len:504 (-) Transcript_3637:19-1530(-)
MSLMLLSHRLFSTRTPLKSMPAFHLLKARLKMGMTQDSPSIFKPTHYSLNPPTQQLQHWAAELDIPVENVKEMVKHARSELRRDWEAQAETMRVFEEGTPSLPFTSPPAPTKAHRIDLINQYLEQWSYKYPSHPEFRELQRLTQMQSGKLRIALLYRIAQHQKRVESSSVDSNLFALVEKIVNSFIERHGSLDSVKLRRQLYKELRNQTQHVDRFSLYSIVRQVVNPWISVRSEQNTYLREWSKSNAYQPPTQDDMDELQLYTGWGRHQISVVLWKMRQFPGRITQESRDIVKEYFERYGIGVGNYKREIELETGLSNTQITAMIHRLRLRQRRQGEKVKNNKMTRGVVTEETKKAITESFSEFDGDADVSQSLAHQLASDHDVSVSQVRELHKKWRDPSKQMTQHKKNLFQKWIQTHGRPQSDEHFQELQQLTQLSRIQLSDLIRRHVDPLQMITQSKRQQLREWLEKRNFEPPTRKEVGDLKKELKLARRQVTRLIREMKV